METRPRGLPGEAAGRGRAALRDGSRPPPLLFLSRVFVLLRVSLPAPVSLPPAPPGPLLAGRQQSRLRAGGGRGAGGTLSPSSPPGTWRPAATAAPGAAPRTFWRSGKPSGRRCGRSRRRRPRGRPPGGSPGPRGAPAPPS